MDLDVDNDKNIIETPERVAKMYFNELYRGLYDELPALTLFENDNNINDIIFEGPIRVYGGCSHHMVMVDGIVYIGYIPKTKLVGISKLGRIAKYIMARPLIQEDAIDRLKNTLIEQLETEDIAIFMSGQHYCTKSRGLKDQDSVMITSTMSGVFYTNENGAKDEFMQLVKTVKIVND
jgi:GTP cyclohydrolase I